MTASPLEATVQSRWDAARTHFAGRAPEVLRAVVVWSLGADVAVSRGLSKAFLRRWTAEARALGVDAAACRRWWSTLRPLTPAPTALDLGRAYELLRHEGRRAVGRYFTPEALTQHTVALAQPWVTEADASRWEVCDPACGGGAFLLAALAVLGSDGARRCWGADIDAGAVAVTRLALWLAGDAVPGLWPALVAHVVVGDALADATLPSRRFDLVVGNPPWLAYAGRAAVPLEPEARAALRRRYGAFKGFPTLHGAMLQRAMELTKEGGAMAMIVPSPVADLAGYGPTRAAVRNYGAVCGPLEALSDTFPGVEMPCMVAVVRRRSVEARCDQAPWALRSAVSVTAGDAAPAPAWWSSRRCGPPWPPETFRDMGFQSAGRVVAEALHRSPATVDPAWIALREGKDVVPFVARAPRVWLDPEASALQASGARLRSAADYARVSFVLRQTARWPIAARVDDGVAFRNSLLAGFASETWPVRLLVALLNSAVVRAQHREAHRDGRQRVFPQVKVGHLRGLATPGCLDDPKARALCALSERLEAAGEAGDAAALLALDRLVLEAYGLPATEADVEALRGWIAG